MKDKLTNLQLGELMKSYYNPSYTRDKLMSWPIEIVMQLTECENSAYFDANGTVLPERTNCLRAFKETGPEDVRVVVIGQDPYHSTDKKGNAKAMGRAFGYNPMYWGRPNSSMLNIIKEIGTEPGAFDTSLQHWVDQGVLLLNTCLTVELEVPLSHQRKYGWEQAILSSLKFLKHKTDKIVYVAWGSHARRILEEAGIPEDQMVITSHPSRYSAHAGSKPFTGSRWHEQVNSKLERGIRWDK